MKPAILFRHDVLAPETMLTRRDQSSFKPAPFTFATFPDGIQRSLDVRSTRAKRGDSAKTHSDAEQGIKTSKSDLPLTSKSDATDKAKQDDDQRKNLRLLRRSTSDATWHTKHSSQSQGKPQSVSRKPKYSFNLYDLYTNVAITDRFTNASIHRKRSEVPFSGDLGCKDLNDKHVTCVSPFKPGERLQQWIRESHKARKLYLDARDIQDNEMVMSSNESPVDTEQSTNLSSLESQHTFQSTSRRSSLIKPRRRSSASRAQSESDTLNENERSRKRKIRTFRWYGMVVRSLAGLLMRMQQLSIRKTHQSAYSEFLFLLAGPTTHVGQQGEGQESQTLLFDKSWFSRTRAWSRMPTWAQSVMKLPPDQRTSLEVQHLKQLLSNMRSFRENITDEMRTKLCQVVTYTRCDKGRIVLRQGHVGLNFYFIFSGSVLVQSDSFDEKTGETDTLVENVLRAGDGFGEIALLGDGLRTASVICKEPTELCQIDKETFLNICPALFSEQLQERIDFARQFEIFQPWNYDDLKQLCFLSQVLDVPHSRVIERNWSTSKFAYFVMKGRVSLLKEFDVTVNEEKSSQSNGMKQGSQGKKKKMTKQFASVGMLYAGDCSDLSVLAMQPRKDTPQITLVSEGACLFRVAVRTFLRLSPRMSIEEYLKAYKARGFPSEEELRVHYLTDLNWSEFKKNLVHIQRLEKAGSILTSIPATLKGSSGWARWPGYTVLPKVDKMTRSIQAVAAANQSNFDVSKSNEKDISTTTDLDINEGIRYPDGLILK